MPTYEVTIPNQGTFQVDSPTELRDDEVLAHVQSSIRSADSDLNTSVSDQSSGPLGIQPGGGFAQRTGRRVDEALGAALELPKSLAGIVTGGDTGRLPAAGRALQGVVSPISALLAPVEAAGEYAATGFGANDNWAKLVGDITGAATGLGAGLLSKAGKLGPYAQRMAELLGAGRPADLATRLKTDPQLRFVLNKDYEQQAAPLLEMAARDSTVPIEQLALRAKVPMPGLAKAAIAANQLKNDEWGVNAANGLITGPIPAEAETVLKGTNWQTTKTPWLTTLGTPSNRLSVNPLANQAIADINLTEMGIKQNIAAWETRNLRGLGGLTDKQVAEAVTLYGSDKPLPKTVDAGTRQALEYIKQKFGVYERMLKDRQIAELTTERQAAIDAARENMRGATNETGATARNITQKFQDRIAEVEGKSFGDLLTEIAPGYHKIIGPEGVIEIINANKKNAQKFIEALAKDRPEFAGKLTSEVMPFMDSDLLHLYKGRYKRAIDNLTANVGFAPEELLAAQRGESSSTTGFNFLSPVRGESGKLKGFTEDLQNMLGLVDRMVAKHTALDDLNKRVNPIIAGLKTRNLDSMADVLRARLNDMRGYNRPISQAFDNYVRAIPGMKSIAPDHILDRILVAGKTGMFNAMLKYNPRFQAVNATQMFSTLWPIADAKEIWAGLKLYNSDAGKEILNAHSLRNITAGGKVAELGKRLGATENFNQDVAFLTMYNRAKRLGLSDLQAGDYGKLRGNLYSQFLGLNSDIPQAFRKFDTTGLMTLFQRFNVKQLEMLMDTVKDRNFPGAAKWLTVNLLLGGMKAATLGGAGWLGYDMYQKIEEKYGKTAAELIHTGLPSLLGVDVSNSMQLLNPPFGKSPAEQLGMAILGPIGSLAYSTFNNAQDTNGVEPYAAKRAFDTILQRLPMFKSIDAAARLWTQDYDLKDPLGRLRYKSDTKDMLKRFLGFRTSREAYDDTFASALMDMKQRRDEVLDYAASRYGQASAAGIDLGPEMQKAIEKEVDTWNGNWPEFPVTGKEIAERTKSRALAATTELRDRLLKQAPAMLRKSNSFGLSSPYSNEPDDNSEQKIPTGGD